VPKIKLANGKTAIVSEEDLEWLTQWKWRSGGNYANRCKIENGQESTLGMHRAIVERMLGKPIPGGYEVDHVNRNGLDNRRENLRLATKGQNAMNRGKVNKKTSSFKGVHWSESSRKWRAVIYINKKQIHLGLFVCEEEAARTYDAKARDLFGDFARLNFPDE
jgi:hypothetical protein